MFTWLAVVNTRGDVNHHMFLVFFSQNKQYLVLSDHDNLISVNTEVGIFLNIEYTICI